MRLFWILLVIKDTFSWVFVKNTPKINQKVHKNDVKLKDLGLKSAWCGDVITGFEHGGTVTLPKLTWIIINFGIFRKQLFLNRKSFQNLHFWQEFEHFRSFLVIFGEFLSAFASKNRISCPFWQEKWHRENDLDWPFEFQAWFMVFNHDKPLIYNFLTNEETFIKSSPKFKF